MEFKIDQIFERDYPMEAAVWCDENGASMVEMPGEGGVRRFQIAAAPELSPEELAAQALEQAKAERAAAVAALTVEVDGMVFDGNEEAQERMSRAVNMAESPEETTEWVLADSTVAIVTAAQLRRACRAAGKAQTVLWVKPYQN
jgi:hypothetical protein